MAQLMDELREAVREQHTRMEALPYIAALVNGQLPLESYVGQLRAMAVIHSTLEHELSFADNLQVKTMLLDLPSRLAHLRRDLGAMDKRFIPDIKPALEHTRPIAEKIRLYRVEQSTDLLGILYVLQGMTLGNAVHLPDVLNTFGVQVAGATNYYSGYDNKTAEYWLEFSCAMNAVTLNQESRTRIIQVALDFFDSLAALFSSFFPINSSEMIYTASMLNPEAGDHAIPADPCEIEAAVTASVKCREEFPYFNERFHERGSSFARSDAAWLVTLTELSPTMLLNQVEWLGRVLGNRGMPRITLERQLELLYQELTATKPNKTEQYEGLLETAQALKTQRQNMISESDSCSIIHRFFSGSDNELNGKLKGTGALIVSAVCDEHAGISEAVKSLLTWLTDAERFQQEWIEAVKTALTEARGSIRG